MDRVAIITGASRGIGAATALLAASRGYAVCVNYLKNEAAAREVVDAIAARGRARHRDAGPTSRRRPTSCSSSRPWTGSSAR